MIACVCSAGDHLDRSAQVWNQLSSTTTTPTIHQHPRNRRVCQRVFAGISMGFSDLTKFARNSKYHAADGHPGQRLQCAQSPAAKPAIHHMSMGTAGDQYNQLSRPKTADPGAIPKSIGNQCAPGIARGPFARRNSFHRMECSGQIIAEPSGSIRMLTKRAKPNQWIRGRLYPIRESLSFVACHTKSLPPLHRYDVPLWVHKSR